MAWFARLPSRLLIRLAFVCVALAGAGCARNPNPGADADLFEAIVRAVQSDTTLLRPLRFDPRPLSGDPDLRDPNSDIRATLTAQQLQQRSAVLARAWLEETDDISRKGCVSPSFFSLRSQLRASEDPCPTEVHTVVGISLPRRGGPRAAVGGLLDSAVRASHEDAWTVRVLATNFTGQFAVTHIYDVVCRLLDRKWVAEMVVLVSYLE